MAPIVFLSVILILWIVSTAIATKAYAKFYDLDGFFPIVGIALNIFLFGLVYNGIFFGMLTEWSRDKGTKKFILQLCLAFLIKICAIAIFCVW